MPPGDRRASEVELAFQVEHSVKRQPTPSRRTTFRRHLLAYIRMASVHPSRLGLVPASAPVSVPLPPRPSANTIEAARDAAHDSPASREDELKRKLLARRLQKSAQEGAAGSSIPGANDGFRGKELLLPEDNGRNRRDGTGSDDSASPAPMAREGETGGLRIKGRGFRKEEEREGVVGSSTGLRRSHIDNKDTDRRHSPARRRSSSSRAPRDDTPDLTSRPRTHSPASSHREDMRDYGDRPRTRSPRARSPSRQLYDDFAERRDPRVVQEPRLDFRYLSPRRDDREVQFRSDRRRYDGSDSRNGSRQASPSYRRHDLPPHIPPPSMQARPSAQDAPQMLPPIWMNAGMAMPPFPPNRGRNDNRSDGRNGPMNLDQ